VSHYTTQVVAGGLDEFLMELRPANKKVSTTDKKNSSVKQKTWNPENAER
jgi:hypothetical protein